MYFTVSPSLVPEKRLLPNVFSNCFNVKVTGDILQSVKNKYSQITSESKKPILSVICWILSLGNRSVNINFASWPISRSTFARYACAYSTPLLAQPTPKLKL